MGRLDIFHRKIALAKKQCIFQMNFPVICRETASGQKHVVVFDLVSLSKAFEPFLGISALVHKIGTCAPTQWTPCKINPVPSGM